MKQKGNKDKESMAEVSAVSERLAERDQPLIRGECIIWFLHPQRWMSARPFPRTSQLHILPSTGDAIIRKSGCWKKQQKVLVSMLI